MKKNIIADGAFFFFFLTLYYLTTNQIFSFDALTNAIAAESNEPIRWFHPNHLLYPFLGVLWFRLFRWFGYQGFAVYPLAYLNSILVAVGLVLMVRALRTRMNGVYPYLIGGLLGSCYGLWAYAVDGRAIGASFFFGALIVYSVMRNSEIPSNNFCGLLGILSALYVFCHGISVFHVPALAWWLLKTKTSWKGCGIYLATFASILAVCYGLVFLILIRPIESVSFMTWGLGYAGRSDSGFWVNNAGKFLVGIGSGWKNFFMMPEPNSVWSQTVSIGLGGISGIVFLWGIKKGLTQQADSILLRSFSAWGILAFVFLTFWSPGQEGFRIHFVLPWILVLALVFKDSKAAHWLAGVTAALLLGINLTGSLGYAATIKHNEGYQLTQKLNDYMRPGDLFLSAESGYIPNYEVIRPYFFPQLNGGSLSGRLFAFQEKSLESLRIRLLEMASAGHRLYFGSDMLDGEVQVRLTQQNHLALGEFDRFIKNFKMTPAFLLEGDRQIYEARLN